MPRPAPLVMGVLNVTPDSFSDGGRWIAPDAAARHARAMVEAGAAIIDIGGESTRPGASRPSEQEELDRVIPVVQAVAETGVLISIDTMRAAVAQAALAAGASMVNDVSGGLADPDMTAVVAATGARLVVMHWRGHSHDMQTRTDYSAYAGSAVPGAVPGAGETLPAVVTGVAQELGERVRALRAAGVTDEQLVLDPGLGFAKTAEHNWQLLAHLDALAGLAGAPHLPVLVGASRKSFLGVLLGAADDDRYVARDQATAALSLLAAQAGAWAVRVHDVPGTVLALAVHAAVEAGRG